MWLYLLSAVYRGRGSDYFTGCILNRKLNWNLAVNSMGGTRKTGIISPYRHFDPVKYALSPAQHYPYPYPAGIYATLRASTTCGDEDTCLLDILIGAFWPNYTTRLIERGCHSVGDIDSGQCISPVHAPGIFKIHRETFNPGFCLRELEIGPIQYLLFNIIDIFVYLKIDISGVRSHQSDGTVVTVERIFPGRIFPTGAFP